MFLSFSEAELPLSTLIGLGAPIQGTVSNVNPVRLDFSVNAERDKGFFLRPISFCVPSQAGKNANHFKALNLAVGSLVLLFVYGMNFCSFNIRLDLAVRWGLFYFTLPVRCPLSFRRYGEDFLWNMPKPPLNGAREPALVCRPCGQSSTAPPFGAGFLQVPELGLGYP